MRIETQRLWLRPYAETDIDDAIGVLGDPETMSFYPRPYSASEVAAIVHKSMEMYRLHGLGRFAVIESSSAGYIGECGITLQDIDGVQEHEVGYRIARSRWGRGYACEAAAAIVKYGFETLGLARLCSYMASDHQQSRRVAEKVGMVLEKQYRNSNNRDYLTCVYAIGPPRAVLQIDRSEVSTQEAPDDEPACLSPGERSSRLTCLAPLKIE